MQPFSTMPSKVFTSFWHNRNLIFALVIREVSGRYRGSVVGILWSFFTPIFMLAVYTFVFSVVFKAKWSVGSESKTEFALVLFVGLMVFNLFAECINRAPGLIVSNANYVKKVIFPLEVLPWVVMGASLFYLAVSLVVWLVFYLLLFGLPPITIILLPLVLFPLILLTMGLSWLLASAGVYLRDVSQVISIITNVLMFLSPIFYPITALPTNYQTILLLNPITLVVEQARDVLIWGKIPDMVLLSIYLVTTSIIAWIGFWWFQKTRKGFADVL